ncbi:protein of unknown function [Burkholderia multivorans]
MTFSIWSSENKSISDTTIAPNVRVRTMFMGDTNDRDPPEEPKFVHYIYEPGALFRTADSYGYDYAVARHDRIAEWLRRRDELRRQRAGHKSAPASLAPYRLRLHGADASCSTP